MWVAVAALTNILSPQLEVVGAARSVSLNAPDSPSIQAMRHIGQVFGEFDSDSAAMIVLEGDKPLGADAHHFYDTMVHDWLKTPNTLSTFRISGGIRCTAGGSQSKDGKAAYVQVYLRGNQGEALSNQSVDAVRDIVVKTPAPPGVKAYVTGAAPLITDNFEVGSEGTKKVTGITLLVIALMLLVVYRSFVTMLIMLVTVLIELAAARGVVAMLANWGVIGLSTYSTNLLTLLRSPPAPTTRSSSWAATRRRATPGWIG